MPYIEIRFDPLNKLSDLAQTTIGRRPAVMAKGGADIFQLEFNPDLTPAERTALSNALPDWMKKLFTFELKIGTLRPPVV